MRAMRAAVGSLLILSTVACGEEQLWPTLDSFDVSPPVLQLIPGQSGDATASFTGTDLELLEAIDIFGVPGGLVVTTGEVVVAADEESATLIITVATTVGTPLGSWDLSLRAPKDRDTTQNGQVANLLVNVVAPAAESP